MRHDILADALTALRNAESVGKNGCSMPASKLIGSVLSTMKQNGYIGEFSESPEKKSKFEVSLVGKINNCKAIRPRFSVKTSDYEKFEKRFLPSRDIGILIISTSLGVMTHKEAKEKNVGGKLLAFVY